jgi:hypothetical protein
MNPSAPRNPTVTRVLLCVAASLFLLNFCAFVAAVFAQPESDTPAVVRIGCLERQVDLARTAPGIRDLQADISLLRHRIIDVSAYMEGRAPRLQMVEATPGTSAGFCIRLIPDELPDHRHIPTGCG